MKITLSILFILLLAFGANAQKERKFIRSGNTLFDSQDFERAEVEYRKAMDKKAESFEAGFNLGDALYKQKKYDEALQQFSTLAKVETDKERLGELYHNIGNTLLAMQKTDESIQAYKESLRNRPNSEETKYNLEYARFKKQQDQQNKDQNKDQNQDQNKDQQNKDQQNQDQDKDKQDQKEQDKGEKKDQQDKDQQNKDQNKDQKDQQQPGKISKEDAQRLLEALQNDEKKVQEKVQKQKAQEQKAKKMKIEKDW